jgi:hypothetical protein
VRTLVEYAPPPVRWFIVDADAITDIDYSAARSIRELLDDLARQKVGMNLRACQSLPTVRHGPARDHRRDRRNTDFHNAPRSHRCGAWWRVRATCRAMRGVGLPRQKLAAVAFGRCNATKAAKALDLDVAPTLLARADEVHFVQ